ncbi:MAG: helix-turn-helix domain-containing protein [Gammaproteobacteria bacterium]|jgi:AraC-like DNA-binding protein
MPDSHLAVPDLPLVRLNLVAPALSELKRRGIDAGPLLAEFDLSVGAVRAKDVFVPADVVYGFMERSAAAAQDPYFGLRIGEQLELHSWSPFSEATSKASNTAELLLLWAINASKDASSAALSLETYGEVTKFHVRRLTDPGFRPAQVDAFWVGILVMILMYVAKNKWDPDAVHAHVCDERALPVNYAGVHITAADNRGPRIHFPSAWLFLPYETDGHGFRTASPSQVYPDSSLSEFVRQALRPRIYESGLTTERAASICGMGHRTLQRKLQEQGTSISQEIAFLRRERAVAELTNTHRSIAEIASQLGFHDPNVFSRAFKKWTGFSPQIYRKRHS